MSTSSEGQDLEPALARFERLARVGWVARGVSYVILGLITIGLATGDARVGDGSEDADQAGALRLLADAPGATLLLPAFAAGLVFFALWQALQLLSVEGRAVEDWVERAAKMIGVLFYGFLALTALRLMGGRSGSSRSLIDRVSAPVLDHPLGRIAVVAVGIGVLLVALRRARRVVTGDFGDELDLSSADASVQRAVGVLGRIGEVGRATSFAVIAWFVINAGIDDRASSAGGLDQSLGRASTSSLGTVMVLITAIGFVVFGLFSMVSARWRKLDTDRLEQLAQQLQR